MFATRIRQELLAASIVVGLDVLDELLETEIADLAVTKGKHEAAYTHKRHGTLGGLQVAIPRPWVCAADDTAETAVGLREREGDRSAGRAHGPRDAGQAVDSPVRRRA